MKAYQKGAECEEEEEKERKETRRGRKKRMKRLRGRGGEGRGRIEEKVRDDEERKEEKEEDRKKRREGCWLPHLPCMARPLPECDLEQVSEASPSSATSRTKKELKILHNLLGP